MLQRTPSETFGPRDMVRADGSYNWPAIKFLARRRAIAEVAKVERWISEGRLSADCRTTFRKEARAALNYYYRDMAKIAWQLHPANFDRVTMVNVTAFGRERAGLRMSAF